MITRIQTTKPTQSNSFKISAKMNGLQGQKPIATKQDTVSFGWGTSWQKAERKILGEITQELFQSIKKLESKTISKLTVGEDQLGEMIFKPNAKIRLDEEKIATLTHVENKNITYYALRINDNKGQSIYGVNIAPEGDFWLMLPMKDGRLDSAEKFKSPEQAFDIQCDVKSFLKKLNKLVTEI